MTRRSSRLSGRDHLAAGHRPRASTTATAASPAGMSSSASKLKPGVGSASLASPTGVKKEDTRGQCHPAGRADEGDDERARHGQGEQLATRGAQRAQSGVVLGLNGGLARQRLGQGQRADQRRQSGEQPPADGLGVDGGGDRIAERIEVARGQASVRPGLRLELGKAGGAVAQAEEVLVQGPASRDRTSDRRRTSRRRRRRGRLDVVGNSISETSEADDAQRDRWAGRGDVLVACDRGPLGRRRQRDVQHAADVHPVLFEVLRGQHLGGVGLVRETARDQLADLGQFPGRNLLDGEVVVVDGVAAGALRSVRRPASARRRTRRPRGGRPPRAQGRRCRRTSRIRGRPRSGERRSPCAGPWRRRPAPARPPTRSRGREPARIANGSAARPRAAF